MEQPRRIRPGTARSNPEPRIPNPGSLPLIAVAALILSSACAPTRIVLPTGPGLPRADFAAVFEEATTACRAVDTLTATLALSGRVGGQRLRRRVQVGLTRPAAVRLEAPAPFGAPLFILVAPDERGTLLFPRDREVVRDAPVREMLDALAGIALDGAELRALLAGCVAPSPRPVSGREYPRELVAVDLDDGGVVWIRRIDSRWRVSVGERAGLIAEYREYAAGASGAPRELRVSSRSPSDPETDLTVSVTQVEINGPLGPEVFTVNVPAGTRAVTVEELRTRGLAAD